MTSLNLVVIRSTDIDRTADFYRQLGLTFTEERHGNGPRHFAAILDGLVLEIYPARDATQVDSSTRLGFGTTEFAAVMHRLIQSGAEFSESPADPVYGGRAVARDPDGRKVEIRKEANAPVTDLDEFARRIEDEIRSIYRRPAMYVGRIGEYRALDCLLSMVHHHWADASRQSTRLHETRRRLAVEEKRDALSLEEWYRRAHPDATNEDVGFCVLASWKRLSKALGIAVPDDPL